MPQVFMYLPHGYGTQTKQNFLKDFKVMIGEAFGFPVDMSSVMIHDCPKGNLCPDAERNMYVMISTTLGKPEEHKVIVAKSTHDLVLKYFGDTFEGTHIIYDEHDTKNICQDGICRYPGMKLF